MVRVIYDQQTVIPVQVTVIIFNRRRVRSKIIIFMIFASFSQNFDPSDFVTQCLSSFHATFSFLLTPFLLKDLFSHLESSVASMGLCFGGCAENSADNTGMFLFLLICTDTESGLFCSTPHFSTPGRRLEVCKELEGELTQGIPHRVWACTQPIKLGERRRKWGTFTGMVFVFQNSLSHMTEHCIPESN